MLKKNMLIGKSFFKYLTSQSVFGFFSIALTAVCCIIISFGHSQAVYSAEPAVSEEPHDVEVVLQRHYLDGEMSEEEIAETIWSMEDFWSFYSDWDLVDLNEHQIIFRKDVNDISPLLKMHGYFGMDDAGTLSIYRGKPADNEVIQSFFQINTKQLKSHLQAPLVEGIPVSTKDQYLDVLKIYEKYAISGL